MLTREQRRSSQKRGGAIVFESLGREKAVSGIEGMELLADGMIDALGLLLMAHVSPEYAHRAFQDAADRMASLLAARAD